MLFLYFLLEGLFSILQVLHQQNCSWLFRSIETIMSSHRKYKDILTGGAVSTGQCSWWDPCSVPRLYVTLTPLH